MKANLWVGAHSARSEGIGKRCATLRVLSGHRVKHCEDPRLGYTLAWKPQPGTVDRHCLRSSQLEGWHKQAPGLNRLGCLETEIFAKSRPDDLHALGHPTRKLNWHRDRRQAEQTGHHDHSERQHPALTPSGFEVFADPEGRSEEH